MHWLERPPRSPPRWLVGLGGVLFLGYLFSGIGWLMLVETEFNGGFDESIRWAWAPWLLITLAFVVRYRDWLLRQRTSSGRRNRSRLVLSLAFWAVLTFMTWPHLVGLNAVLGGPPVEFSGSIFNKWASGGRTPSNVVEFRDAASGRVLSIEVDDAFFAAARMHKRVHCRYRVGPLGFAYRWRNGAEPKACRLDDR